jgi:hypothetical protein
MQQKLKIERLLVYIRIILEDMKNFYDLNDVNELYEYANFAGEIVIAFRRLEYAKDLSVLLSEYLNIHNQAKKKKEQKIYVRIGLAMGNSLAFNNPVTGKIDYWDPNLTIIKRLVTRRGGPNHILLSEASANMKEIQGMRELNRKDFHAYSCYMKDLARKEKVFSLYRQDDETGESLFGNKDPIETSIDILEQNLEEIDEITREPIRGYLDEQGAELAKNFVRIYTKKDVLNISYLNVFYDNLWKYSGEKYDGSTTFAPSFYMKSEKSYLDSMEDNVKKGVKIRRFLIITGSRLKADIHQYPEETKEFIKWHEQQKVVLIRVDPDKALKAKQALALTFPDIGLWYDKYALQFGDYIFNNGEKPEGRNLIISGAISSQQINYYNCESFFDELTLNNPEPITLEYYEKAIIETKDMKNIIPGKLSDKWKDYVIRPSESNDRLYKFVLGRCQETSMQREKIRILDAAGGLGYICNYLSTNLNSTSDKAIRYDISFNEVNTTLNYKAKEYVPVTSARYDFHWNQLANEFENIPIKHFDIILAMGNSIAMANDIHAIEEYLENFGAIMNPNARLIVDHRNFNKLEGSSRDGRIEFRNGEGHSCYYSNEIHLFLKEKRKDSITLVFRFKKTNEDLGELRMYNLEPDAFIQAVQKKGFIIEKMYCDFNEIAKGNWEEKKGEAEFYQYVLKKLDK